jgi:hypothetical protein
MLLARMQALVTCNSALRILVSLYSLRSGTVFTCFLSLHYFSSLVII